MKVDIVRNECSYAPASLDEGMPLHSHKGGVQHSTRCDAGEVEVFVRLRAGDHLIFDSTLPHGIRPIEPASRFTNVYGVDMSEWHGDMQMHHQNSSSGSSPCSSVKKSHTQRAKRLIVSIATSAAHLTAAAQVCTVEPPPGTGLVDRKGWVHCMKPGVYTLRGAVIRGQEVAWCGFDPDKGIGRFAPIEQTASRIEWTRPDGVREAIPITALYPPM